MAFVRRRFFVEHFDEGRASLRGEAAQHLGRVLRAVPGQLYELSDGQAVWLARIETVQRDAVAFRLVEPIAFSEPAVRVTLLLSLVKFDRFEWCLEKATELGAEGIVPLAASRSEKALIAAAAKRARRWERILVESAQQSRRVRPPKLLSVLRATEAFEQSHARIRIVLSESREAAPLRTALEGRASAAMSTCALAFGPEGGWSDEEMESARCAGFIEASLGSEILRTETAVIAALAIVNYAIGN